MHCGIYVNGLNEKGFEYKTIYRSFNRTTLTVKIALMNVTLSK